MTNLRGVCIGVSTADCIPVLLYDRVHHAVCAIHAGWRGTFQQAADYFSARRLGINSGRIFTAISLA